MKLSLIIITRNREKQLLELLNSAKKIEEKEIIIIDNNDSKNNYTKKIKTKKSLSIYRQKNDRSLSGGRNLGMEKSIGKYLMFIDDDDLLHEQFIKFINKYKKDYDVLRFCETHFPYKSKRRPSFSMRWLSKFDKYFLYQQSSFLYKRDLLIKNNLKYKKIYGEDRVFYSDLLKVIQRQRMIHKYSIWYRNNLSGMTRENTKKLKQSQDSLIKFLKENNYDDELKRYMKDKREL